MDTKTTGAILDSIHGSPASQQLAQEWERMSPEELVAKSRKVVYGIVTPGLAENGESPQHIEEVTTLFEALFKSVESGSRSRSRSTS